MDIEVIDLTSYACEAPRKRKHDESNVDGEEGRGPKRLEEDAPPSKNRVQPFILQETSTAKAPPPPSNDVQEQPQHSRSNNEVIDLTGELEYVSKATTPRRPETIPYDTCFGVIDTTASISQKFETSSIMTPVEVQLSQKSLSLYSSASERVGACFSPALCELDEKFKVTLKAFLRIPDTPPKRRKSQEWTKLEYQQYSLRVVVYGIGSARTRVAYFLSDQGLFLQHPVAEEYDSRVPYFNPQYLPGPDGSMPTIENLEISTSHAAPAASHSSHLNETEKARILQIFDSASDVIEIVDLLPSPRLKSKLKAHQLSALAMMVGKESADEDQGGFSTIWKPKQDDGNQTWYQGATGSQPEIPDPTPIRGGVLADEMGLGKTLSVLALIARHVDNLQSSSSPDRDHSTLIVTPKSTIPEWEQQIERHFTPGSVTSLIFLGTNRAQLSRTWSSNDIVLTTYDTLRSEQSANGPLFGKTWDRIILDEAHVIRNRSSQIFKAVCKIQSPRRWCLTGTPIQNSLDDFGALLAFIGVPPFQSETFFKQYISNPVKSGDKYALKRLRQLIKATCLRRTKELCLDTLGLPPKQEDLIELELDKETRSLYQFFTRQVSILAPSRKKALKEKGGAKSNGNILTLISILRLICNHGTDLLPNAALSAWNTRKAALIDWDLLSKLAGNCSTCGLALETIEDSSIHFIDFGCGHTVCSKCDAQEERPGPVTDGKLCQNCSTNASASFNNTKDAPRNVYHPGVKVKALLQQLNKDHKMDASDTTSPPFKSVIFTYWTRMANLIEKGLRQKGLLFARIDGQTSLKARTAALKMFNADQNCSIMLATIGSAGEGINLTVANFVHIMEPQWNPMVEAQAVDRVHRLGQSRVVSVRRYVIKNSIEKYVKWVQEDKLRLIHRSLSNAEPEEDKIQEARWHKLAESLESNT